jgi:hypothetical protein
MSIPLNYRTAPNRRPPRSAATLAGDIAVGCLQLVFAVTAFLVAFSFDYLKYRLTYRGMLDEGYTEKQAIHFKRAWHRIIQGGEKS